MKSTLVRFPTYVTGPSLAEIIKIENTRISKIKIMQTEDLIMRQDGPAKLDIEIKSDWLLICFTFVTKSPGSNKESYYFFLVKHDCYSCCCLSLFLTF